MVKLVSWNVRYFSHATRGITSTDRSLRGISLALASMDPQPDIIALQEIDDFSVRSSVGRTRRRARRGVPTSALDRFTAQLNRDSVARNGHVYQCEFFAAQGHSRNFPLYSTGLAILYRNTLEHLAGNAHEPHEITHRRIKRLAGMKQKRICAWSRFRDEGGRVFDVFNTHLSLPAFFKRHNGPTGGRFGEAENQIKEVEGVLECIDRNGNPERTVLVGDFNALPGSRVYNRVLDVTPMRDAHATFLGKEPDEMAGMHSAGFMNLRYRLDHIFSGPAVRHRCFQATAPYGSDHPWRGLSDHSPIVTRFDVS